MRIDPGPTGLVLDGTLAVDPESTSLSGVIRWTRLTQIVLAIWFAALFAMGVAIPVAIIPDLASGETSISDGLVFLVCALLMWLLFTYFALQVLGWTRARVASHLRKSIERALST